MNTGWQLHLKNTFADFFSLREQEVRERSRALCQHNHPTPSVVGMWFLLKHFYPLFSSPTPPVGTNMSPHWLHADWKATAWRIVEASSTPWIMLCLCMTGCWIQMRLLCLLMSSNAFCHSYTSPNRMIYQISKGRVNMLRLFQRVCSHRYNLTLKSMIYSYAAYIFHAYQRHKRKCSITLIERSIR